MAASLGVGVGLDLLVLTRVAPVGDRLAPRLDQGGHVDHPRGRGEIISALPEQVEQPVGQCRQRDVIDGDGPLVPVG